MNLWFAKGSQQLERAAEASGSQLCATPRLQASPAFQETSAQEAAVHTFLD